MGAAAWTQVARRISRHALAEGAPGSQCLWISKFISEGSQLWRLDAFESVSKLGVYDLSVDRVRCQLLANDTAVCSVSVTAGAGNWNGVGPIPDAREWHRLPKGTLNELRAVSQRPAEKRSRGRGAGPGRDRPAVDRLRTVPGQELQKKSLSRKQLPGEASLAPLDGDAAARSSGIRWRCSFTTATNLARPSYLGLTWGGRTSSRSESDRLCRHLAVRAAERSGQDCRRSRPRPGCLAQRT